MTQKLSVEAIEGARLAVSVASDKQASDIIMLDMRGPFSFTDYFVIITGENHRQMEALQDEISYALKTAGLPLHHSEGSNGGGWVILDFGDLVVHVFAQEEREYYELERLWSQYPVMLRVQ